MGQFKLKSVRKWLRNSHKQAAGIPTKKMKRTIKKRKNKVLKKKK